MDANIDIDIYSERHHTLEHFRTVFRARTRFQFCPRLSSGIWFSGLGLGVYV